MLEIAFNFVINKILLYPRRWAAAKAVKVFPVLTSPAKYAQPLFFNKAAILLAAAS